MDSIREFSETASTLEWAIAVVGVTAFVYVLGVAINKLFGPKNRQP